MSLWSMFKSAGPTGFGYGSTAEQVTEGLSLAGQTILVTGCNSGIGQEACRVLALRGAMVPGTARTKEKASAACVTFPGKAIGYACELSDPSSVRACVAAVKGDGQPLAAYGQSKMADLLFAKELQRRFAGTKKTAYAVHPGVVDTNLARNLGPVLSRVLAAIGAPLSQVRRRGRRDRGLRRGQREALPLAGSYLSDSNAKKPRPDAEDAALATRLWAESEKIVQAL